MPPTYHITLHITNLWEHRLLPAQDNKINITIPNTIVTPLPMESKAKMTSKRKGASPKNSKQHFPRVPLLIQETRVESRKETKKPPKSSIACRNPR